ncbi:MAG: anti-sigma factor [Proteobacteria bacterium]|nr:anti-sigma factor [Pseudomonadota bacterium]
MSPLPVTEDDLHAYVDGALTPARRQEVEAWLAEHADDAARVAAYLAQKQAIKALFDPVLAEPLPDQLHALTVQPLPLTVNRKKWPNLKSVFLQRLAAGMLVAAVSGVGGWLAHGQYLNADRLAQGVPLPKQAAVAHVVYSPDARRPVEVAADQEEALVKWLSKRLGTPVSPPKLGGLGYELVGGRLLPGNAGPVAQFMYQDASGQRMTLYVTTENASKPETGFRFAREGQVNVFYWVDGKFGYALSASVDKGELAKVATAVYDQLETK